MRQRIAAWTLLIAALTLVLASASFAATDRNDAPDTHKWNFSHIYPDFDAWQADYERIDEIIEDMAGLKGKLAGSPENVLEYYQLSDEGGMLSYKVYCYVALQGDVDLANNDMQAKRQEVSALFSRWGQATSWFTPELLEIPYDEMKGWLDKNLDLALYRFAIDEVYRQQEYVLDESGEHLLSLQSMFNGSPRDIYQMLTTADVEWPTITLSTGEEVTVSGGQYYAKLQTARERADREAVWRAFFETYEKNINTYASIYNAMRLESGPVEGLPDHAARRPRRQCHSHPGRGNVDRRHEERRRATPAILRTSQEGSRPRGARDLRRIRQSGPG
jgi:oligoendopeptidase F